MEGQGCAEGEDGDQGEWRSPDDPDNPFNWPKRKKWQITLCACLVSFVVGLNSTAITAAAGAINARFNVSDVAFTNSYWPITAWNLSGAFTGLLVLPAMEHFGIRWIYLCTFALFILFIIPQALAPNFATLIVSRVIAGGCGNVLQNAVEGIVADTFDGFERDLPLTLYVLALLEGVTLGPVFGGAIVTGLYWRWILYIQIIIYGAIFMLAALVMRETRGPVILSRRSAAAAPKRSASPSSRRAARDNAGAIIAEAVVLPSRMFLTEPVVFFFTLWSAFTFGLVFVSTQSVAQVYSTLYDFTEPQTGLVQAAIGIGELIGFFICLAQNAYYARPVGRGPRGRGADDIDHENKIRPPEARLAAAVPTSFLCLTGGLFWYAWASQPQLHWTLPTAGLGVVGIGIIVIMQAVGLYVADGYARYAASAIAAVAFGENVMAAFLPLAAQSMYTRLGFEWASSLLGFVALVLSFWPIVLWIKGKSIRRRSQFMRVAAYK